jgi:hypothetical protein
MEGAVSIGVVVFSAEVRGAVEFDRQARGRAVEVYDVAGNYLLAPEMEIGEGVVAESVP